MNILKKKIDYSNIVVSYFNSRVYRVRIFISIIEYNITLLKNYNNFVVSIDEIKFRIECIKTQNKIFVNYLEFIDRYELYLIEMHIK